MRELGLKGLPGPKKGVKNLKNVATCEDLVKRDFHGARPQRAVAHRHHRAPDL